MKKRLQYECGPSSLLINVINLNTYVTGGGVKFVFRTFYYFRLRFLTVIFFNCPTIGYASFGAAKN